MDYFYFEPNTAKIQSESIVTEICLTFYVIRNPNLITSLPPRFVDVNSCVYYFAVFATSTALYFIFGPLMLALTFIVAQFKVLNQVSFMFVLKNRH